MGRIKVQASQTAPAFELLPKGEYDFMIDAVAEGQTKNNNPQLVLDVHVIDGPYTDKKLKHFMVVNEKTGGFVKELVDATGVDHEAVELEEINPEDGKPFLAIEFESEDLIGRTFHARAHNEEYNGKENTKLTRLTSIDVEEAPAPTPNRAATKPAAAAGTKAATPAANAGRTAAPAPGAQPRRSRV